MSIEHIRCEVLSWGWREQPDLDSLARMLTAVSGGTVHLSQVDTGSDQYAIVLSSVPLSQFEADAAFRAEAFFGSLPPLGEGPDR